MLSLSSCPDAILINVWHHLLGDLHTFIALAQTCRRLRQLSEQDDNIWQSACFVSGFGRPLRRGNAPARDMPYRRLARSIVSHGAVCEIRSCIKANACFGEQFPSSSLEVHCVALAVRPLLVTYLETHASFAREWTVASAGSPSVPMLMGAYFARPMKSR